MCHGSVTSGRESNSRSTGGRSSIYPWNSFMNVFMKENRKDLISACFIGDTAKLDETDENMRITK